MRWPDVRQPTRLLGPIAAMACMLACAGVQAGGVPTQLMDYPRDPGSFCALNPEGCPPAPVPSRPEPEQDTEALANKKECLDACAAGGEVLESVCRRLQGERRKALCWTATKGSKVACQGMCYAIYK